MTEQRYPPLEEYAFLGDCHDWALVHRDGSIDWCCFERNEGRTTAARILDWDTGGHCLVRPTAEFTALHRYLPDTNVLVTEFHTDDGVVEVTDALVLRRSDAEGAAVDVVPRMQLTRRIRCTEGRVSVEAELLPRFDHGLTSAHVQRRGDHQWTALGGEDGLAIWSDLDLSDSTWAKVAGWTELASGDERWLSFRYARPEALGDDSAATTPAELADRLDVTVAYWQSWAAACTYEGPYRDAVVRSALVLKALTDARTGAVAAAPTTSLPEDIGGTRNFDYRYAWMRDASTMLAALYEVGYTAEADAFMRWLGRATAGTAEDLQVMYRLSGGRMIPEVELPGLEGYRGSAPVRIGNAAAEQFQLDVYGELVETVWRYHRHGRDLSQETIHLLTDVLPQLEEVWTRPDAGIWEQRGNDEPFVSSKLYAWRAADLLARLAEEIDELDISPDRCRRLRDEIRAEVEHYGIDRVTGGLRRAFGRHDVDASNLLAVLLDFWPADDDRARATIAWVEDELQVGPLVHRYHAEDGLAGQQNAFFWTSFWMVEAKARSGRRDEAEKQFTELLERRSPLGLLSEECDDDSGALVGNYPQAISHVGLIRAALALQGDLRDD